MLAAALMFAAAFAYISGFSFVLQKDYGLTAQQFSLIFAVSGLGITFLGQAGFLIGHAATGRTLHRVNLAAASLAALGVLLGRRARPSPAATAGLPVRRAVDARRGAAQRHLPSHDGPP
jgi:hypothetical protein